MQPYPLVWGHYDVCKTQIYTEEGKVWDYMACQPESTDMTKYLKVKLDPPDITCGDPPETFCAMVRQPFWKEYFGLSGGVSCMSINVVRVEAQLMQWAECAGGDSCQQAGFILRGGQRGLELQYAWCAWGPGTSLPLSQGFTKTSALYINYHGKVQLKVKFQIEDGESD